MLIKCPECELQVSDKALMCPHCGYPLAPQAKNIARKPNKRKRLPNGFGQISEIKGRNLRKPFRAMITVGKTETGHPISKPLKPITYFETYNEAYTALMEYHKNPYELEKSITVQELHDRWVESRTDLSPSSIGQYKWAWGYCKPLYNVEVRSLTTTAIKTLFAGIENPNVRIASKNLFNLMLDYAIEGGIVDRNVARAFSTREKIKASEIHTNYTDEELALLWEYSDKDDIDLMLIQCYTGLRPAEIGLIELSDFDHEKMIATGGVKTESGKNRPIIFHSKIIPLVERRYQESVATGSKYLFTYRGKKITYSIYNRIVKTVSDTLLSTEHRSHDGRVTFATMAKKAGVDEYVLKKLMGHRIDDITERVYTKRDTDWLRSELEKI